MLKIQDYEKIHSEFSISCVPDISCFICICIFNDACGMKLSERKERIYKYGSKLYFNETIDKVIELFYTLKDNRTSVIGKEVGLNSRQVSGILDRYDDNVKNFQKMKSTPQKTI